MTGRENGFDAIKGAAIILVVFGHVWLGLGSAGLIGDGSVVVFGVVLNAADELFFFSLCLRQCPRELLPTPIYVCAK